MMLTMSDLSDDRISINGPRYLVRSALNVIKVELIFAQRTFFRSMWPFIAHDRVNVGLCCVFVLKIFFSFLLKI